MNNKNKKKIIIPLIILAAIIIGAVASYVLYNNHLTNLKETYDTLMADAKEHFNQGDNITARNLVDDANEIAIRLRCSDREADVESLLSLIETMVLGDQLFNAGSYGDARLTYSAAISKANAINGIDSLRIGNLLLSSSTRMYVLELLRQGQFHYDNEDYDMALSAFTEALLTSRLVEFEDGISSADIGIYNSNIAIEKLRELELQRLEQEQLEAQRLAQEQLEMQYLEAERQDEDLDTEQEVVLLTENYIHNRSIYFDLITLIDNQNAAPANLVRMGTRPGLNEGWYNGCGWISAYNALLILENPLHPAQIVHHIESGGGTVLDGVFGTFPHAIERLFHDLGYSVNHTLFPGLGAGLDAAVRSSRVSILAYTHTRAAHFVTIRYIEEEGHFIVYNDGFARRRSSQLGLPNQISTGAAIDSIDALIRQTPEIIFTFSLITIN